MHRTMLGRSGILCALVACGLLALVEVEGKGKKASLKRNSAMHKKRKRSSASKRRRRSEACCGGVGDRLVLQRSEGRSGVRWGGWRPLREGGGCCQTKACRVY